MPGGQERQKMRKRTSRSGAPPPRRIRRPVGVAMLNGSAVTSREDARESELNGVS
jgi:hypothetical protein